MKMKMKILSLMLLVYSACFSQQLASNTTDQARENLGSVTYTIAQPIYKFNKDGQGTMTENEKQSYEISIVFGVGKMADILISMSLNQNPEEDYINLITGNQSLTNLSYALSDNTGRIIQQKKIIESNSIITLKQYKTRIYYVTLMAGSTIIKTFKIIKR